MRLINSPSSASIASRLYFNGQRSSGRNSFESESDLISFSDSEYQTDLKDISSQVSRKMIYNIIVLINCYSSHFVFDFTRTIKFF